MSGAETERHTLLQSCAREGRILSLLLAGRTLTEICAAIPISRSALWRVRSKRQFEAAFKAARAELLAGVIDKLRSDASDFADVLHTLATDQKARGSDRVLAARHGLDLLLRGVETLDFEERLRRLEQVAAGEGGK